MFTKLRHRLWPVALLADALFVLEGCYRWSQPILPARQYIESRYPERIRVVMQSGAAWQMHDPHIVGDSLIGHAGDSTVVPVRRPSTRIAVPLSQVAYVSVQQPDVGKTTALVLGLGVTAIIIAAAAIGKPNPPPPPVNTGSICSGSQGCASCPLVYSWDGRRWRLDSGTFGGAIVRALQRTDLDNLDYATARDGVLRLKLANQLDETDFVDELAVLAVDHDASVAVAPDPSGGIHTIGPLTAPIRAADFRGRDALARVLAADGWNWESNPSGRDTSQLADVRDGLELEFVRPHGAGRARLVLDANNTPWAAFMMQQLVAAHGGATQA